jgi:glycosyltransferase involved in cell wall biosynthesis
MLKLISDNRSGSKLEVVIPTFNEDRRIKNIMKYYGEEFDVVLLDDGSTDATVTLAIQGGATVFRRVGEGVGENHFVHYVNDVTKSGCCFYMFADEFIEKAELRATYEALKKQPCVVLGKRVDWIYGERYLSPSSSIPRGQVRGSAIYNPNRLHASLEYRTDPPPKIVEFDVLHLHRWSMKDYFGQSGRYAYMEVEQFRRQKNPAFLFFKRFVAAEFFRLPQKLWRERRRGFPFLLWMTAMSITVFFLGVLSWLEQRFLMHPDKQLELYSRFYVDKE